MRAGRGGRWLAHKFRESAAQAGNAMQGHKEIRDAAGASDLNLVRQEAENLTREIIKDMAEANKPFEQAIAAGIKEQTKAITEVIVQVFKNAVADMQGQVTSNSQLKQAYRRRTT